MDQFNKPCALLMTGNVAQNFKDFVRDVKIYFTATETDKKPDVVQVARLKNLMGVEALNQYSARATVEEGQETMEDVINVLSEICLPKKNEIWDVYQFFDRKQQSGETFDSFYSELRRRVKCCCFDAQEEKLLKVQIVLGVNSKNVQQRLLREDMSLIKMVNYCKSVENAEKKAQVLNSSVPVNFLSSESGVKPPSPTSRSCEDSIKPSTSRGCGDSRLFPPRSPQGYGRQFRSQFDGKCETCGWFHGGNVVCPARNRQCNACGERGHFSKVCDKVLLNREVDAMDNHESSNDEYYVLNIDAVNINKVSGGSDEKSWTKKVLVNNYPIEFKLDTGSETNILPSKYLHFLRPRPVLKKSSVKLEAYGGHHIFPKGSISVLLETKDRIVQADFLVVDLNSSVPILGLNSCVDLDLIKKVNVLLTGNDDVFTTNGSFSDQSSLEEGTLPKVSSVSQEMPDIPFYKVGIEIVHWAGTDYLVLIDYYSRWIEIRKMLTKRSTEELSRGRFTVVSFPVIVLEKPQN
ncbi:hypothetical protein M8J77_020328 [Diaphorina citri]|nr:hypothetical protein M8J77_020328 [Diaphorina citri]